MPESKREQKQVEDEVESILACRVNDSPKQKKVSGAITIHSSLAAISAMCDEVRAMDLQIASILPRKQHKQKSGLRTPSIWVSTPKTGIPTHTPIERNGTISADTDDRMLPP